MAIRPESIICVIHIIYDFKEDSMTVSTFLWNIKLDIERWAEQLK